LNTDKVSVNLDDFIKEYGSEVQSSNNSYKNTIRSMDTVKKSKNHLSKHLSEFKFYNPNEKSSSLSLTLNEFKSGKLRNELLGTYTFVDSKFIEKSPRYLQLQSSNKSQKWNYKIDIPIGPKNEIIVIEVFDVTEENDVKEEDKDEDREYKVRMKKYDYKGNISISLAEIIVGHIMDNKFSAEKAIVEEKDSKDNSIESQSSKMPGIMKIESRIKLGADFKELLEHHIAEKLMVINQDLNDRMKRAHEKALVLEQGTFW